MGIILCIPCHIFLAGPPKTKTSPDSIKILYARFEGHDKLLCLAEITGFSLQTKNSHESPRLMQAQFFHGVCYKKFQEDFLKSYIFFPSNLLY